MGSFGSTRRRILAIGQALDAQIERDIVSKPKPQQGDQIRESINVGCVSVDSVWLNFSSSPSSRKAARDLAELKSPWTKKIIQERHVNIVAGRATFADRTPRLHAYVHKQVPSAGARLDQFLHTSGVGPNERVTVISDDAGEFGKAVQSSKFGPIFSKNTIIVTLRNQLNAAKNLTLSSGEICSLHIQLCIARSMVPFFLALIQHLSDVFQI